MGVCPSCNLLFLADESGNLISRAHRIGERDLSPETPKEPFVVRTARRLAPVVKDGRIRSDEYAENLIESASLLESFDDSVVQSVIAAIPAMARDAVMDVIADVLKPGYRRPELHFGGPGPSEADRERLRDLYTDRMRAFAAILAPALRDELRRSPNSVPPDTAPL